MSIINKELAETLRDYISSQRETIRTQLTELVAFLSVHGTEGAKQACIDAAQMVTDIHTELGTELKAHHTVGGSIALSSFVSGSLESVKTILLYPHYNVQPAGDKSAWTADSWALDERDGHWYGRGTADCKGNVVMYLAALCALRDGAFANHVDMSNIKLIVEGFEECGSASLNNLIATQPELFDADVILVVDVGSAEVGQLAPVAIPRSTADVEVRVDALEQPAYSGMFDGAAPDVLVAPIRVLDSLHDENGFTSIGGPDCSWRWEGLDHVLETFRADAGVLDGVDPINNKDTSVSDLTWTRPSMIVTGIDCPSAASAVNITSSAVMAYINFHIPGSVSPAEIQGVLEDHLHTHAPWGVKVTVERDKLANPFWANAKDEAVQLVADSLPAAYDKETANVGERALIPLYATLLEAIPGVNIALYNVEEPQACVHLVDESVNLNEIRGIAIGGAVFLASVNGI